MNVSLPESLKHFVDEQVSGPGFGTTSEYVRELIRYDRDRTLLRERILASGEAEFAEPMDAAYFERLRENIRAASQQQACGMSRKPVRPRTTAESELQQVIGYYLAESAFDAALNLATSSRARWT